MYQKYKDIVYLPILFILFYFIILFKSKIKIWSYIIKILKRKLKIINYIHINFQ